MGEEDRITIKFPKGISPKHLALVLIFGLLAYFMSDTLKSIFTEGLKNPNYAIVVIALVLIVLCLSFVYLIRALTKEKGQIDQSDS